MALDESIAEIDPETAAWLAGLIQGQARIAAVMMATHLADELVPNAGSVLRVEGGRVKTA